MPCGGDWLPRVGIRLRVTVDPPGTGRIRIDKFRRNCRDGAMKAISVTLGVLWIAAGTVVVTGAEAPAADKAVAAKPTLEELRADFVKSVDEFMAKYRAAETDEERRALRGEYPQPAGTIERMMPLIVEQGDDPAVLEHVEWVITASRGEIPEGVTEIVMKHKESKEIAGILLLTGYDRSGALTELVEWAREGSAHQEVRGVAAYAMSQKPELDEEEKVEALKFAVENAGEIEVRGRKIAELAAGALFEAENLGIGKVAGEIEGVDQDGVSFKLSDYRGKVVVLDFWGDW